jgi:hypothetical protein
MADFVADISKMHEKYKFHEKLLSDGDFLRFRWNFIEEEFNEMKKALEEENAEEFVDGGIDLIVVILGLFDLFRVDSKIAWNEVHTANMHKERGHNPSREGSMGVDLVKPDGWRAPSHIGNTGLLPGAMAELKIKMDNEENESQALSTIEIVKDDEREAVKVLRECISLMIKKSEDYNSGSGGTLPIDYYPFGMISLYQMLHTKLMRVKSVMENALTGKSTNFESIEDSLKDLMIYSSFAVEFNRRQMRGQQPGSDLYGNLRLSTLTPAW